MPYTSPAVRPYYPAEAFLSAEGLSRADETVVEIFKVMFGFEIQPIEAPPGDPSVAEVDERTAIVGFSGSIRGSCQVRLDTQTAKAIASAMLGETPVDDDDDSINDAIGELCNMLAGGWKNSIPEFSSECALSPPTVISGHNYKVHVTRPSVKLSRTYRFNTHSLHLALHCEDCGVPGE